MPGMSVHVNLKNVCNLLHVNLTTYVHEKIIINIYFVQNKCTLRSSSRLFAKNLNEFNIHLLAQTV